MRTSEDVKAEISELQDAVDTYSDDFNEHLREKLDQAALNWLTSYGIPDSPYEVWSIFYSIYRLLPALLVNNGYIELTAKGRASVEEVASRKEGRKGEAQQSLFGSDSGIRKNNPTFGQYL